MLALLGSPKSQHDAFRKDEFKGHGFKKPGKNRGCYTQRGNALPQGSDVT